MYVDICAIFTFDYFVHDFLYNVIVQRDASEVTPCCYSSSKHLNIIIKINPIFFGDRSIFRNVITPNSFNSEWSFLQRKHCLSSRKIIRKIFIPRSLSRKFCFVLFCFVLFLFQKVTNNRPLFQKIDIPNFWSINLSDKKQKTKQNKTKKSKTKKQRKNKTKNKQTNKQTKKQTNKKLKREMTVRNINNLNLFSRIGLLILLY